MTRPNVHQIDAPAELFVSYAIMMWSIFPAPFGRGEFEERIDAAEYEMALEKLWRRSQRRPFGIKTTEASHYRRFVIERDADPLAEKPDCA